MSYIYRQGPVLRRYSAFWNSVSLIEKGSEFHGTAVQKYPSAALMKLPDNYQDINASEVGQFSPLRSREISGQQQSSISNNIDITVGSDPHVEPYDCRGAVSLSSSMQSNVPSPFGGQRGILGMPGSQWGQGHKYISDYLHDSHYLNLRNSYSRALHSVSLKKGIVRSYYTLTANPTNDNHLIIKPFPLPNTSNIASGSGDLNSASEKKQASEEIPLGGGGGPPTRAEQLKRAVAAYGSTVIVFHVCISLVSLGGFYLLVTSGLDVMYIVDYLGLTDGIISKKLTANTGSFVLAYAVHKVFAPVRIGITLTATPFIVRYLRKVGILKPPVKIN